MKLKCPNLLKPLDTIIQENYQPFYPSEPFRILRFQMRHPVVHILLAVKTPKFLAIILDLPPTIVYSVLLIHIPEKRWVKNVRAIVVCGLLMK